MTVDDLMDDVVWFELPEHGAADALTRLLLRRWQVRVVALEGCVLLGVDAGGGRHELGLLLRAVSAWAGERDLGNLAFQLDGRVYTMPAAQPDTGDAERLSPAASG